MTHLLNGTGVVCRRELAGYFATPVAYVFLVIFLFLSGLLTFFVGNFFERGQADLDAFFTFHPWLYLFLVPALAMRLWAEERRAGTIELLLTLPIPLASAVLGKFLAAWLFTGLALVLTMPLWLTINYLGAPDNGAILAGYIGSWLMAGGYLAIGAAISAMTKNQVVAFVIGVAVGFLFTVSGTGIVLGFFSAWAPQAVIDVVTGVSFMTRFQAISQGVLDLRDLVYFLSVIGLWLFIGGVAVEAKKTD